MISNYLKIAFRNLINHKAYTLLNVLGLTIGLTCFAFIVLWVKDEWSYDRFNENADRIYRVVGTVSSDSEVFEQAVTGAAMGPALKNDYPEVENFVRLDENDAIAKKGNQQFVEEEILLTDHSFFDVFSYKLTKGDPKTALKEPYSIVLTESKAQKYFPNEDPIGKTLDFVLYDSTGKGVPYKVTGVIPDAPKNAHFTFNFLVSFETLIAFDRRSYYSDDVWGNNSYYTYVMLTKGSDSKAFEAKFPQFKAKHLDPLSSKYGGKWGADYSLQALPDIYLKSHRRYEINPTGSLTNLYIFGTVGLFILLIAGINYMNLATARSVQRAREVGVKKVMGALKSQLVGQYLLEAVLLAVSSLVFALCLCYFLQPVFYQITNKDISLFNSTELIAFMAGIALLLGVLSGIYPAFFISSYQPTTVLKGSFATSGKGVWLRKSLVVMQFTVTIVLIVGILVINSQMSFIRNKDLGFNKDALLTVTAYPNEEVFKGIEGFRNDILRNPYIKSMTTSNSILVGGMGNNGTQTIDNKGKEIRSNTYRLMVDYDYMNTMGIKLIAGRNFSREFPSDSRTDSTQNYILNEAAVAAYGWETPDKGIGKPFAMSGRKGKVVGIVKDFHFNSLQHKVEPMAMLLRGETFSRVILKIDMNQAQKAIAVIESEWKKHFPDALFMYDFVDKRLGEQYEAEARFSKIFLYFSILSVLIACLGLYGLTSFATEQRTKEIGIRKVLGASIFSVTTLITKDFIRLVVIAIVVASPIAWYFMNKWLQDFSYKIDMEWWFFVVAGIVAVAIAILTVSYQAIKAALMNPVKSLKAE
ncbi:ABC transporter permease [Emticicia sp. BO119]|uniref:ABC transporter permease n=1 Tax=Emticicia sp. BO119 TaxID=2757768 RepID=UPI0015F08684|nr:ABC transporter permease [Emticicia sp. BO119]MBA4850882.1 ABC transporter permease [Emticicia sp. BO119]